MSDRDDVDWSLAPLPSGRHGLTREYVLHSQRARLLDAAMRVAGTQGYSAMTVSAVIARAGVSRRTFYELFPDREHCFLAAYELLLERVLAGVRDAAASACAASWPARLRAALGWALGALAARPDEARVVFVEVFVAGPRALARRDAALRELARLLAPRRADAPRHTALARLMPEAVVGALYELVYVRVLHEQTAELPRLLPQLLYCALAPFLGPADASAAVEPPRETVLAGAEPGTR